MKKVRWYHHALCALLGHVWRFFTYAEPLSYNRKPLISEANTCRRCLTPITETDEGILE